MTAELKKIVREGEGRALKAFAGAIVPAGFVTTKRRL